MFLNYNKTASQIDVFLDDAVTNEQIENIKKVVLEKYKESEIIYISKEQELERMKEQFKDKAYLLDGYEENNIFPARLNIKSNVFVVNEIKNAISSMPGVKNVTTNNNVNPYQLLFFQITNK